MRLLLKLIGSFEYFGLKKIVSVKLLASLACYLKTNH